MEHDKAESVSNEVRTILQDLTTRIAENASSGVDTSREEQLLKAAKSFFARGIDDLAEDRRRATMALRTSRILALKAQGSSVSTPGDAGWQKRESLDRIWALMWRNPPDGSNRSLRKPALDLLQAAADDLSAEEYRTYRAVWDREVAASAFEEDGLLYYIHKAVEHTVESVRTTRVERGLALWYVYNMGYVFKTSQTTFGIDLHARGIEELARHLDLLLITHNHEDHYSARLAEAMVDLAKPVVTMAPGIPGIPGTIDVETPTVLDFAPLRVRVTIGDHHWSWEPPCTDDVLKYEINTDTEGDGLVIYHTGAATNPGKASPIEHVDILVAKFLDSFVSGGGSAYTPDLIRKLDPELTIISHILELGHLPTPGARWSLDLALKQVARFFPESRCCVLSWGQRYLWPGTEIKGQKTKFYP